MGVSADSKVIKMNEPSPSGNNGRNARGQFTTGNHAAQGNPLARRIGQLRSALVGAVTVEDMVAIARKLVEQARGGDVLAMRLLLERTIGKPVELDVIERLEQLESALEVDS